MNVLIIFNYHTTMHNNLKLECILQMAHNKMKFLFTYQSSYTFSFPNYGAIGCCFGNAQKWVALHV